MSLINTSMTCSLRVLNAIGSSRLEILTQQVFNNIESLNIDLDGKRWYQSHQNDCVTTKDSFF